ncbi:MAG: diacylglycerol kinase family protein [Chitinophagaceae bacterium]
MANENLVYKDTLQKETTGILKILFVINRGSGNSKTDWPKEIEAYFQFLKHSIELFFIKPGFKINLLKEKIAIFKPDTVVAVGGDGTVGLVAECLLQKNISLGILPAGSANGLAKELGTCVSPVEALDIIIAGRIEKIHITMINKKLSIHLSDIGFNAYMIKKFEQESTRGIWGYAKATIKALWTVFISNKKMQVSMTINNEIIETEAAMIVIANATQYGNGALINPLGSMEDELFEVIVVKKISFPEIFKMMVSHAPYNPEKTEVFQTRHLTMRSSKKVHFQVDGEYLGKVNKIEANLIPAAIQIIVPDKK